MAFHVNADRQVNGFGTNATSVTNFGMDIIEIDQLTDNKERQVKGLGNRLLER